MANKVDSKDALFWLIKITKNPVSYLRILIGFNLISIATIFYLIKQNSDSLSQIEDTLSGLDRQIGLNENRLTQIRFENRGKHGWDAGKKFLINFIKENHEKYYDDYLVYRIQIIKAGDKVLSKEIKRSQREFGTKSMKDYRVLSSKTMGPFLFDLEKLIKKLSKHKELPHGWEYDVVQVFNISMSRWMEELYNLKVLVRADEKKNKLLYPGLTQL